MNPITNLIQRTSYPMLRIAMGIVLFWIGGLKFFDPSPVVGLLGASLPFLAFPAFVYVVGAVEVACALALFTGFRVDLVGLVLMGLFSGTILIFIIAPKVVYGDAGFPLLQLPGEFLIKDLVLFAASATLSATAASREMMGRQPEMMRARAA